jgi:molybdopterin converting factor small subunit
MGSKLIPMRVKVYAPSFLCDASTIDENGTMELPENATLKDVYKKLRIPFIYRKLMFCTVNHKKEKMKKKLSDQDVISFISIMAGG